MKKKLKAILILITIISFFISLVPFYISFRMNKYIISAIADVPGSYTALVPGAMVYGSGRPSPILKDRLESALELYQNGIVKKILVSGDHGKKYYDEVNGMKKYLLQNGVDTADLFLDHAGFNTYNSIVRAKKVFDVKDVIISTQKYHLPRALFIARGKGINAYGYIADRRKYPQMNRYKKREYLARIKSFFEVKFFIKPKYLGNVIPITGDSRKSWD